MKVAYTTNSWGAVMGHCGAMNNVNSAYYLCTGSVPEAVAQISQAGFEQVEIFDGNLLEYEGREAELAKLLEENHVGLKGVYSAANFIYDEILDEELYRIKKAAVFAKQFGATVIALGGGATRYDGIREDDYTKLGKALDMVCDMGNAIGMTPHFHPHMGSLVQAPNQIDKVMAHTRINLCPDTGHVVLGGGDPYSITEKYIDRITYIHLKDVTKEGMFCPLGTGVIDFKPILALLKEKGKDVQCAVECDGWNGAPLEGAMITYKYLEENNL